MSTIEKYHFVNKEPFSPSRSNAGQRDSAAKINRLNEPKNGQLVTCGHTQYGGYSLFQRLWLVSAFQHIDKEVASKPRTAHTAGTLKKAFFASVFILLFFTDCSMNEEKQIRQAVRYQMEHYPASRLKDIYKNFFQDFYGPGHLLNNPEAALNYLQNELKEVDGCSLHKPVEGTGYKNTFVRVDLCLITEGKISLEEFTWLFLESAETFKLPEIEEWQEEWNKILSVIEEMGVEIEDFEKDKAELAKMLEKGEYVVHHTKAYVKAYDPHYRIIRKDLLEEYSL